MSPTIPQTTRVIVNANPPVGDIQPDTFKVEERPLPELENGQVLVKILALGNEPAQRNWIDGNTDPVSRVDRLPQRSVMPRGLVVLM
jgi:NADPH-dependent curcumin reductase CurA